MSRVENLLRPNGRHGVFLTPRQGLSARPSDERRHRDLGEAAPERHPHRQQLGDVQSPRSQPDAQLWVRRKHSQPSRCFPRTFFFFFTFSWPLVFPGVRHMMLLCPAHQLHTEQPFCISRCLPLHHCVWSVCCLSVRLFQGGLSGETESGHRLPDKRRLQKRHGRTHPGETDIGTGTCATDSMVAQFIAD